MNKDLTQFSTHEGKIWKIAKYKSFLVSVAYIWHCMLFTYILLLHILSWLLANPIEKKTKRTKPKNIVSINDFLQASVPCQISQYVILLYLSGSNWLIILHQFPKNNLECKGVWDKMIHWRLFFLSLLGRILVVLWGRQLQKNLYSIYKVKNDEVKVNLLWYGGWYYFFGRYIYEKCLDHEKHHEMFWIDFETLSQFS